MKSRKNLAASIGGWSARHRWTALLIWIAFVAAATMIGNAIGTAQMKNYEGGNGDSRAADQIVYEAKFKDVAGELVLVQAKDGTLTADAARFHSAVTRVRDAVLATGQVENVRTPYDAQPSPVTRDRRTALIQFDMRGEGSTAEDRVQPVLEALIQAGP